MRRQGWTVRGHMGPDMYLYMGFNDYPNTIYHEIKHTATERKFNKYTKKDEYGCIKREDDINKVWLLRKKSSSDSSIITITSSTI